MTMELLKLRLQIARGNALELWGSLTDNNCDQLTGRRLRLDGEMQYSLTVSRRHMEARRRRATALNTPRA